MTKKRVKSKGRPQTNDHTLQLQLAKEMEKRKKLVPTSQQEKSLAITTQQSKQLAPQDFLNAPADKNVAAPAVLNEIGGFKVDKDGIPIVPKGTKIENPSSKPSVSVSSPVSNTTPNPSASAPTPVPQVDSNKPTISNTGTNTKSVTAKDKEGWLKKAKDAIGQGWDTYKGALTGKKGGWAQAGAIAGTAAAAAGAGYGIYKGVKAIKNRNKKQDEDQEQLNEQQELRAAFSRSGEQNEFASLSRLLNTHAPACNFSNKFEQIIDGLKFEGLDEDKIKEAKDKIKSALRNGDLTPQNIIDLKSGKAEVGALLKKTDTFKNKIDNVARTTAHKAARGVKDSNMNSSNWGKKDTNASSTLEQIGKTAKNLGKTYIKNMKGGKGVSDKAKWITRGVTAAAAAGAVAGGVALAKKKKEEESTNFSRSCDNNEFASLERLLGDNYIEN